MKNLLFFVIIFTSIISFGQCPNFYDFNGNLSNSPQWIICDGNNYTLGLQSDVSIGNYSIDWGDGSSNSVGTNWSANSIISHFYASTVQNYTITISLIDIPCVVVGELIMEEPTNASIQIPFGGVTSICAPGSLEFINSSTDVSQNTTFIWNFFDGTSTQIFDHTNAGQLITHLYNVGTVNCATQVTLTAENECNTLQGGPSIATFTPLRIWDIDNAQITPSANTLCYPDNLFSFQNTSYRNCYAQGNVSQRYEYWNLGDYWGLGYDSIINWRPWPPSLNVDVSYPGVGSYEVMLIDSSFCGLDTAIIWVNIVDPPVAGLSADKDSICVGESITFHNLSSGAINDYIWDFGDGSSWTQTWGGDIVRTFFNSGDYDVMLIPQIAGTCRDTAIISIHVSELPSADFTFDNNHGCDSMFVQFSNNSSFDVVNWDWSFGNGNTDNSSSPPIQHYTNTGSYSVSLEVQNSSGCVNTHYQQLEVHPTPIPLFSPSHFCENVLSQFADSSISSEPIIAWEWNFGDGSLSSNLQNPNHTYTNLGQYNVILTVNTNYCFGIDSSLITVEPKPVAQFTSDLISGCNPLTVNFQNQSSANTIDYQWDFGDNISSNNENPFHTFNNSTFNDSIFSVELIASTIAGCMDTFQLDINVLSNPISSFTDNSTFDCAPLTVDFTNNSQNATDFIWNFGDNSAIDTSIHTSHSYNNQSMIIEIFDVQLIAIGSNGCKDSTTNIIIVYPEPIFNFSSIPSSGCSPLNVNFPTTNGAVIYQWDFGDGNTSSLNNPSHIFHNSISNSMIYDITMIATSPFGCTDTNTHQVVVYPNPTANFSIDNTNGCSPLSSNIDNNSIGANTYHWDMGDGNSFDTTITDFNYQFINTQAYAQNYEVQLILENSYNCKDSAQQVVSVYPAITADFIPSDTVGCSPLDVSFINNSIGGDTFNWDFGDNVSSNSANDIHQYSNITNTSNTFNAQLTIESGFGCKDSIAKNISVHPNPTANFSANPEEQHFPNSTVSVVNNSSNGNWNFLWDFGDGTIYNFENPSPHTYDTIGEYTISLYIFNSYLCSDSAQQVIKILENLPTANFDAEARGCSPLEVQFLNTSSENSTNFSWDFGDGTYSGLENPLKTYINSGVYSVSLTVLNSIGSHSIIKDSIIEVYETPTSIFSINTDLLVEPGDILETNNLSLLSDHYLWHFGDSSFSTLENPTHYYEQNGNFMISLIAYNQNCSDTSYNTISVRNSSEGSIIIPNSFTPIESNINDGNIEQFIGINDIFHPVILGAKSYELDIFNRWGDHLFNSKDMKIGWNGYYKGELCQQDVYVYKIKVVYLNHEEEIIVGQVTLVR